jgi:CPA2 family monovalent cation:H+ antiporter-2
MLHHTPLITTIAAAFGIALILGFIAARLKLPALVGYLIAGILIGPQTPGFIADVSLAGELAEIGVMLLMFGVGLHFSLDDLMQVRKIAVPGALIQILAATCMGAFLAHYWGWNIPAAIVFGLALSVASTVVLLRALESTGSMESMNGRIAVGWLIVEDLAMVIALVLLPSMANYLANPDASPSQVGITLIITLLKAVAFIALMMIIGRRIFPALLWQVTRTGSRELFTLCVVAAALTIAWGASTLFGVSFALGAFVAGMVLRESEFAHRAAEESLPLRDAFAVLFFVSVGMLFNPTVLLEHPLKVLAVVGIIIIGKSLAAIALVLALRYPISTALTIAVSLAQIGEFSFILASLGVSLQLLPQEGQNLILAGALISITLNPLLIALVKPLMNFLLAHNKAARILEHPVDPLCTLPDTTATHYLSGQIVLVGYGRVGRRIGDKLLSQGIPFVVAEQNRELVERARAAGIAAISGDASDPAVLIQAHIARAAMLVVSTPDTFDVRQMITHARTLNPTIETLVRTHNEEEADFLQEEMAQKVFLGENELAKSMIGYILGRFGKE